jgi:hypothetical protein
MHDTTMALVAPAARQGGTAGRPSNEVRLARGIDAPSGEFRLAPPPSKDQPRPSSEVRLARGLNTPSGGVRLARRIHPDPRVRSASLEG